MDPVTSNGCDSFPDGIGSLSWRVCCDAHDVAYTTGGDLTGRLWADWELAVCVNNVAPVVGFVMLVGVVAVGWLFYRYSNLRGHNLSELTTQKESRVLFADKSVSLAIAAEAKENQWPEAHLGAVVMAESGGTFWVDVGGEQRVPMLYEPHVMYRNSTGAVRQQLVREGLASPKWNKKLYARTIAGRWKQLERAVKIAGNVAYVAASYGVGQVLGENWKSLGYASPLDFFKKVTASARGQIDAMTKFIKVNNLDDELTAGQWDSFARGYNGPQYKKNKYAQKMAKFASQWGGVVFEPDGMLRMGAKGKRVRELQQLLRRANYYSGNIDGDYGIATRDSVLAFQKAEKITPYDGVYGPKTEQALSAFRQGKDEKLGHTKITDVEEVKEGVAAGGGGAVGTIVVKEALESATDKLSPYSGMGGIVDTIITVLTVATVVLVVGGVAWGLYGWWKSKQTVEV